MNPVPHEETIPDDAKSQPAIHVLLIEDNEDDAILTRQDLSRNRRHHFEMECMPTLAEGMERLRMGGIDVVLLDLTLPDCRGLATFERLSREFRHVPILVLTGLDDEDTGIQTVRLGAQDYLVKDRMNGDMLGRAVSYAIERKQANRQLAILADELARRNARLQEELELAHEIQRSLLADTPARNDDPRPWHLAHRYLATESLAGDFFKVYPLSDGRAGVLICDVMGHGVRSALVAALLCGLVEEFEAERECPHSMLNRLNAGLHRVLGHCGADMFATACYMVVDPPNGEVTVSSAGHPAPYLLRTTEREVVELNHGRGPALGLFDSATYPEFKTTVAENDVILLYTDGISETEGRDGDFFETQLPETLRRRICEESELLLDHLLADARRFAGSDEFHDDVCLVALRVGPAAVGAERGMEVPA
jgi:phosphoserine phosphatase RsbU/P